MCVSQKELGIWNKEHCKTIRDEKKSGEIDVYCQCNSLTPQTLVNDALGIFADNQLAKDTFSTAGVQALTQMNVFKYGVFYELIGSTILYLGFLFWVKDVKKRTNQQLTEVSQEGSKGNQVVPEEKINDPEGSYK